MNPFELKPKKKESLIIPLSKLFQKPYDKETVSPYTKVRIILAQGTEFEANWNSHQMARHTFNNDVRRQIAFIRRSEQLQHKMLSSLKPQNESILETTLSYEQLAVDLTAIMARSEKNEVVKKQLDFALLEDFDHLYRFTNMLDLHEGKAYEKLVGDYTEIMPGRPTVSEFRHPNDDIRFPCKALTEDLITNLHAGIITAAEQQTMNYYMNLGAYYHDKEGRKLYSEIALIEEQHVSGYESLKDPDMSWFECLLMHEYTECYLYYSLYNDETNPEVKRLFEMIFEQEVIHLHEAADLLWKYEGKHWNIVIPNAIFPELLKFGENKNYIRNVLKSVEKTAKREGYEDVKDLPSGNDFCFYQKKFCEKGDKNPSHKIMESYIKAKGTDLRYEIAPHPVRALQDRKVDNISVGRCSPSAGKK